MQPLLEQEQTAVQADPDNVDEVPVVADALDDGQLARVVSLGPSAGEENTMATRPMKTWIPWRPSMMKNSEAVGVGARARRLVRPFVDLVARNRAPRTKVRANPHPGLRTLAVLLVVHGHPHGPTRRDEDQGENPCLEGVELGTDRGQTTAWGADREEGRERGH